MKDPVSVDKAVPTVTVSKVSEFSIIWLKKYYQIKQTKLTLVSN